VLTTGDQYFNTTANELRVWNGSTWQAASTVGGTVTSLNVTGVASFADGSAAAPSITNDGDTDTGIFYPAANQVAIATNGTQAMLVDASQNVTISSDQISSATSHVASQHAMVLRSATTNQRSIVAVAPNGSGGAADFCISSTSDLQTNYNQIRIGSDGTGFFIASEKGGTETTKSLRFGVAGTALTIDTSNNVGIGTSSPSSYGKLATTASSGVIGYFESTQAATNANLLNLNATQTNSSAGVRFQVNSGTTAQARIQVNGDSSIVFQQTNTDTERMRIDSSGAVGVGASTPSTFGRFVVSQANVSRAGWFHITATSTTSVPTVSFVKQDNDSTTSQILVDFYINGSLAGQGQINANGANAAAFGAFSDSRLKENIVEISPQLANIMALRPVEFDYIASEGGGHQIGFIAQEVQAIYPDLVGERADGMLTLSDMNKNDARLIKAIQEQQALITSLTARIAALESK